MNRYTQPRDRPIFLQGISTATAVLSANGTRTKAQLSRKAAVHSRSLAPGSHIIIIMLDLHLQNTIEHTSRTSSAAWQHRRYTITHCRTMASRPDRIP
jgi:hypothetical protein